MTSHTIYISTIDNTMSNCAICEQSLESFDIQLNICGDSTCEFNSRTLLLDNFIQEFVSTKPKQTILILSIAQKAISKNKFHPVPIYHNLDVSQDEITHILTTMGVKSVVNSIVKCSSDIQIFDKFGPVQYGLIKFILKSNLMDIQEVNLFSTTDLDTYEVSYFDNDLKSFDTNAKDQGISYLYHGSSAACWYSIMMNGLKVYSNTPNMVNGASYGAGIYLSDSIQLSHQYAAKSSHQYAAKSSNNNNIQIVGVFEVLGDSKKYYKNYNIFVVGNPKVLKLKYLLHFKKNANQNLAELTNAIDRKFGKMLVKEKKAQNNYMSTVRNKRLLKEVEYVMSGKTEQFGLSFDVPEDNFHIWYASVTNIDQESLLYKDMQTLGVPDIKMEIRFEPQYPIKPPFVRIVEPIFLYRTGNITLGGSICMELLTNQGWSPACSIESLLIQIKANILETGQLDHTKVGHKYSYQESQVAFKRMLLSHGWV